MGAVATQASVDPGYGMKGLELMRPGTSAPDALRQLVAADKQPDGRQVAMIDAQGRVDAYTGKSAIAAAGRHVGDRYSVQANMMANNRIWPAMAAAFESTNGNLADRFLAALEAAEPRRRRRPRAAVGGHPDRQGEEHRASVGRRGSSCSISALTTTRSRFRS